MAPWFAPGRFPDSDISGSTLVSSSPKLFAAVHVLHRLSTPRHPPRALHSLTVSLRHDSSLSRPGLVPRTLLPRFLERLELLPILLTVAAIFRRLLLLQLSKTRVEVDDLVLEHQPRCSRALLSKSLEVGARIHEPDIDTVPNSTDRRSTRCSACAELNGWWS